MIGAPRLHLRVTESTNERARELAAAGAPHGTIVTADEQTAGRGRHGRAWLAPPGSALLLSVIVRDLEPRHALLPLATAVAVCEACEAVAPVECRIKWPNDVWIERRKLCGILVEGRPQEGWAVIGLGVNVATEPGEFPDELRDIATSLRAEVGDAAPATPEPLLSALLPVLEARLGDEPDVVLSAWRERDALRGEHVRWGDGEGTAAGVADDGSLLVETAGGTVVLSAGEVHLERPGRPGS